MVHARAILTALDTQQAWEAQILSQPAVSSLILTRVALLGS